jgi:hypothetical protein
VEYVLLAVIVVALATFVVAPLLRRGREPQAGGEERLAARVATLEARKESKYREIRDAELDRAAGKLSEGDYASVDADLRREAVEILRELDAAEAELRRTRGA